MVDASVEVSAALQSAGNPRQALVAAVSRGFIALSNAVDEEIVEVLGRPRFSRILTEARRVEILRLLEDAAVWAEPSEGILECRESKDNKYLELAADVQAAAIVSGDEDLLVLNPWRGIPIFRPRDFLIWLREHMPDYQKDPS